MIRVFSDITKKDEVIRNCKEKWSETKIPDNV